MTDVTVEPVRDGDLALILRDFGRFWSAVPDDTLLTAVALARGATGLKALTSPSNERSVAFHRRMGFTEMTVEEDYAGSGQTRVVMRRPLRGVSIAAT